MLLGDWDKMEKYKGILKRDQEKIEKYWCKNKRFEFKIGKTK